MTGLKLISYAALLSMDHPRTECLCQGYSQGPTPWLRNEVQRARMWSFNSYHVCEVFVFSQIGWLKFQHNRKYIRNCLDGQFEDCRLGKRCYDKQDNQDNRGGQLPKWQLLLYRQGWKSNLQGIASGECQRKSCLND